MYLIQGPCCLHTYIHTVQNYIIFINMDINYLHFTAFIDTL